MNLSARLRSETIDLHRRAERAGMMPALLHGRVDAAGYGALLRNLHAIYIALEHGLARHAQHPGIAPLHSSALFRAAAIADDLNGLHGPHWAQRFAPVPATRRYVQRLTHLDQRHPALLAAHAYVRYLGDLSGGQVLRGIVVRTLQLDTAASTRFYDFGSPDAVAARVREFRAGLDAIAPDDESAAALVAEARRAFLLHAQLFVELGHAG